jgi:hypothetical protein
MGRIRMNITIRNESDATLNLIGTELESGEFTPGLFPPPSIGPGERRNFKGEGDLVILPTTGTEGRVRYAISGEGELYIHWNSPLVESAYDNTFHIFAPPGWEVSHWGGQGHEAELGIRLRRTRRRNVPRFNAAGRGFRFSNRWDPTLPVIGIGFLWNKLFESFPGPLGELGIERVVDENALPITRADAGLCGGMVYSVMDYYNHHVLPPTQTDSPNSREDILFQYIRDRLFDSFDVAGQGHRYLGYSSPHYPNGDEGVIQAVGLSRGRSWVTYREEWPKIQADIDADRPSPMGLIQSTELDIGKNHQVLGYAYEKSGQNVRLYIYDPNSVAGGKPTEVTYDFDVTRTDGEVHITRTPDNGKRIWCFFRTNGYVPKSPPGGRRVTSVLDALLASSVRRPPTSVRTELADSATGPSVMNWMRSL